MSNPKLSVKTKGPRCWSICVCRRSEAEMSRRTFQQKGLRCGPIQHVKGCFEFEASVKPERDNWTIRRGEE